MSVPAAVHLGRSGTNGPTVFSNDLSISMDVQPTSRGDRSREFHLVPARWAIGVRQKAVFRLDRGCHAAVARKHMEL